MALNFKGLKKKKQLVHLKYFVDAQIQKGGLKCVRVASQSNNCSSYGI